MMPLPPRAVMLARLLAFRRFQVAAGLSLEGFERWGSGSTYAGRAADEALVAHRPETRRRIAALCAEMRAHDPAAVAAFVASRLALLERAWDHAEPDSTARFVAEQERDGWRAWGRGDGPPVEENCVYVHFDRAQFTALYGFGPSDHGLG